MMKVLLLALIPVIAFSIFKNGIMPYMLGYGTVFDMLRPLLMILLSIFVCFVTEYGWARIILKEKKKSLQFYLKNSYFIYPGLFLALVLPINTPLVLVMLGAFVATFIGKIIFGGFGNNVFNPALVGALFVTSSYYNLIAQNGGYMNLMEVDTVSAATPLTNLGLNNFIASYDVLIKPFGDIWNFISGGIPGSLGETSAILIIIGFLYLIYKKVITWHIPVLYVGTVFVLTYIIGTYFGLDVWYPLFHIFSGGLLFGAVFMATDPVTSPTNPSSQVLYGISLGILTVIFRFSGTYPEGVLTSILTMNMLVVIFDKIGSRGRVEVKKLILPVMVLLVIFSTTAISIINKLDVNEEEIVDETFEVIEESNESGEYMYHVSQDGFHGPIEAVVYIDNDLITDIEIVSQSESVWLKFEDGEYLSSLIGSQENLDNVDVISGATYTSNYLKDIVNKTLVYHGDIYEE
jgi:electron transport complex protein RnfD